MAVVFMKWLETSPDKYDRGIQLLTLGRLTPLKKRIASQYIQPGNHVLEIGCGTGTLSLLMAERGAQVTAIDAFVRCDGFDQLRLQHLSALDTGARWPDQGNHPVRADSGRTVDMVIRMGTPHRAILTTLVARVGISGLFHRRRVPGDEPAHERRTSQLEHRRAGGPGCFSCLRNQPIIPGSLRIWIPEKCYWMNSKKYAPCGTKPSGLTKRNARVFGNVTRSALLVVGALITKRVKLSSMILIYALPVVLAFCNARKMQFN